MGVVAARSGQLAAHCVVGAACLLATAAGAQEAGLDRAAMKHPGTRARMELSTSTLPLFDSADGATRSNRVDMIWLPPRRPSLGLALGLTSSDGVGFRTPSIPTGPVLDLGFHWRYDERIDVSAWRRMTPMDATPLALAQDRPVNYGARVEMKIDSGQRGFRLDRSFLGFQLESGARIGVRRQFGHPMLYYRTNF